MRFLISENPVGVAVGHGPACPVRNALVTGLTQEATAPPPFCSTVAEPLQERVPRGDSADFLTGKILTLGFTIKAKGQMPWS